MTTRRTLEELEREAQGETTRQFAAELGIFDAVLSHLSDGGADLSGVEHDRGLNFLSLLLINDALNALLRAREDMVRGYPVQALTLCRAAFEDWAVATWVEAHPQEAPRWLREILPEHASAPSEVPFKTIWAELNVTFGQEAGDAWGTLTAFAHPRSLGLGWLVHYDDQSRSWVFHVGPHFAPRDVRRCLQILTITAALLLNNVDTLHRRMVGVPNQPWIDRGRPIVEAARTFLLDNWNTVQNDG